MKRKVSEFPTLLLALAAIFAGSCATMTEVEREEREYMRIEWREQFVAHRAACSARGGRLEFDGPVQQDRNGIPKYKVRYICTLSPMAVVSR